MVEHLTERTGHARPSCLLPVDSVQGLVQEEPDAPGEVDPSWWVGVSISFRQVERIVVEESRKVEYHD